MTVTKTKTPENSILNTNQNKYDYVDSFRGVITDVQNKFSITDIGKAFFTGSPQWVDKLFTLRNKIVAVFGLKTSEHKSSRQTQLDNFNCELGEHLGLFSVFQKTDNEVILGADDKHLNFRVSLYLDKPKSGTEQRNLTISTTVEFHNWFGRLYFLPVHPFHKLIVPTILKGIILELEKRN